jgi:hypothetical protein
MDWPTNPTEGQLHTYLEPIGGSDFVCWLYINGAWEHISLTDFYKYDRLNHTSYGAFKPSKTQGPRDRPIRRANGNLEYPLHCTL